MVSTERFVPAGAQPYDQANEREGDVPFEEQLRGLERVVKAGKVRGTGCWGKRKGRAGRHPASACCATASIGAGSGIAVTQWCWHPFLAQVRYIGVSNETSYGVMRFVQVRGWPAGAWQEHGRCACLPSKLWWR